MKDGKLRQIKRELSETASSSQSYLNRLLRLQALKWLIVILLYHWLWNHYEWIKWSLVIVIPVGLAFLWRLLSTKFRIERQVAEIEEQIERINEL